MTHKHSHGGKTSEWFIDKKQISGLLEIAPGSTVLDAGCGNGYMAVEFAALAGQGGKVYAFDVHKDSLSALKANALPANLTAREADITSSIPLEANSVDLVYLSLVYHGFTAEQRAGFIHEVKRVLRPEGRLAIVEFDKVENGFGPPMSIRYSPEKLTQAVDMQPASLTRLSDYLYLQIFTL